VIFFSVFTYSRASRRAAEAIPSQPARRRRDSSPASFSLKRSQASLPSLKGFQASRPAAEGIPSQPASRRRDSSPAGAPLKRSRSAMARVRRIEMPGAGRFLKGHSVYRGS